MATIQQYWTAKDQTGYYGELFPTIEQALMVERVDPNFEPDQCYRIIGDNGKPITGFQEVYFDREEAEIDLKRLETGEHIH